MRIIICGAGEVGSHLAKMLTGEAQNIVLIDSNAEKVRMLDRELDALSIVGNCSNIKVLKDANVAKADLLVAVTSSQETNLLAAMLGKKLGAKITIARTSDTNFMDAKNLETLKELGVDSIISPEDLAAEEIARLIKLPAATEFFEFSKGELLMIGSQLTQGAPIIGKNLIQAVRLDPEHRFISVAIQRNGDTIIPDGKQVFMENDMVYVITRPDGINTMLKLAGKDKASINDIIIVGGSKTGIRAAKMLEKSYHVKLIEESRDKCYELAEELSDTLVINGDGCSLQFLNDNGIGNTDAFIALTGKSETNIIASLMAKNQGVEKTIALVEDSEYIKISQDIGINTIINKKLIAAGNIFKYVRQGNVVSMINIHGMDAEVLEFEVTEKARVTRQKIRDLKWPKAAIIAGVIRDGEGHIALGDFKVEPGDKVVVFSLPEAIHDVENFFKKRILF